MWHVTVWIAVTRACESGVPAADADEVQILRIRHKKVCRNPRLCKTANATGFRVTLSATVRNSVTARKDERQQADGRSRMTLAPDCATEFKARLPDQGSRLTEKAYAEAALLRNSTFLQRGRLRRRWRNRKSALRFDAFRTALKGKSCLGGWQSGLLHRFAKPADCKVSQVQILCLPPTHRE